LDASLKKKILYISGSIGLGHIAKDLAIAQKIRELSPDIGITWLAAHPATLMLQEKGEKLHPYSARFSSYSASAEDASVGTHLNLVKYVFVSSVGWLRNVKIFKRIITEEKFDLVIGNETYEIIIGLIFKLLKVDIPFIMIYDFIGLDSMSGSPLEKMGNYILNWIWSRDHRVCSQHDREILFIGDIADIPDKKLGPFLPNRREYAKKNYNFLGYIIRFDPLKYKDRSKLRAELGYGEEPLIICSIGGTSIGKNVLELCDQAYSIIKKKIPGLRMVLVTGPRLSKEVLKIQSDVEVRGFVPDLYKHFAACDMAIVQGGHSSTLELAALGRPFVYFPIEGHSEQEYVADRLSRYNAGIRLYYSETTPQSLAEHVIANFDKDVDSHPIPVDGARKAAQIVLEMLQ
jgi:UDP-N-acetylglucosamine:LPS N-acetylglucosamine transferase